MASRIVNIFYPIKLVLWRLQQGKKVCGIFFLINAKICSLILVQSVFLHEKYCQTTSQL